MCCDSGQPPIPILKRAITQNKEQVGRVSGGGTRWIALDRREAVRQHQRPQGRHRRLRPRRPAPDPRWRVHRAIAQGFIPPGIPGYEESGGLKQRPTSTTWPNPKGDPAVKKYSRRQAQRAADRRRRLAGGDLLTIATNADPGNQTAQVAQGQLQKMGFKLNYRKVPQDTLYTKFCGVPKSNYVICPNVGWFKDFTDPQSLLEPTFKGDAIKPQGNVNWSSWTTRRSTTR